MDTPNQPGMGKKEYRNSVGVIGKLTIRYKVDIHYEKCKMAIDTLTKCENLDDFQDAVGKIYQNNFKSMLDDGSGQFINPICLNCCSIL